MTGSVLNFDALPAIGNAFATGGTEERVEARFFGG